MGVDCALFTNKERISLDRLYVFSPEIEELVVYPKKEFIRLIRKLCTYYIEEALEDNDTEQLEYNLQWLKFAEINAGEANVIISDSNNSELYYKHTILNTNMLKAIEKYKIKYNEKNREKKMENELIELVEINKIELKENELLCFKLPENLNSDEYNYLFDAFQDLEVRIPILKNKIFILAGGIELTKIYVQSQKRAEARLNKSGEKK